MTTPAAANRSTTPPDTPGTSPLCLRDIRLVRDDTVILDGVSFEVGADTRWLIVGPNGCGKTSLLRIAALYDHPTSGTVDVLGERLGRTDVRVLRQRIGFVSAAFSDKIRPTLSAHDVVRTARYAALEPWWHRYTTEDDARAHECLAQMGVGRLAGHEFATLSSGERTRVLLARSLVNHPAIVLLDEPAVGLDLAGREQLVTALGELAADPGAPPFAMVSHHVEDVPTTLTHALLMRAGTVLASGPLAETVTSEAMSECFGMALRVERRADGRFHAWAAPPSS